MSKTTKHKRHVKKNLTRFLKKIKMFSKKKTFDVSFNFESLNDQNDIDVKSKKSEKNVDERRISSSNSFNSSNESFSSEKKIDSSITF